MPKTLRLFLLVALSALAFAPAASAHRWHDWNNDSDPSWTAPDPAWDNSDPSWDDSSDQTEPEQAPEQAPPDQTAPQQQTVEQGPRWNANQGDPQETPSIWNNTPPVNLPSSRPDRNPWSSIPALPVSKTPTVPGKTAMIRRNGLAAIPKGAPAQVRAIISAANTIIGKPYKWGGGHGRLFDSGYDCSGSVSYALIRSGLLGYPMVSGSLAHFGLKGLGKYVTIYANKSHVYMEVAGLRLDTSSVGDPGGKGGVRWRPPIGKRFGFAVRHIGGI
jgi:cell wall-associated NlpC family hydrolase